MSYSYTILKVSLTRTLDADLSMLFAVNLLLQTSEGLGAVQYKDMGF